MVVVRDGLIVFAFVHPNVATIAVGSDRCWVEPYGLAIVVDSLVMIALAVPCEAAIIVSVCVVGVELYGFAKVGDGLVVFALFPPNDRRERKQASANLGLSRMASLRVSNALSYSPFFSQTLPRLYQAATTLAESLRLKSRRASTVIGNGLIVFTLSLPGVAAIEIRFGTIGVDRQQPD